MLKWIKLQYARLEKNLSYFDLFVLIVITCAANKWYSVIALGLLVLIQLFLFCSTFDFSFMKLALYRGSRKVFLQFLTFFCIAVGIKMIYLISFSDIDIGNKSTLLFQITFFFIFSPIFSNWYMRRDSAR